MADIGDNASLMMDRPPAAMTTADDKTRQRTDDATDRPTFTFGGRIVYAIFWLIGALPLRWLHGLGARLGQARQGRVRRIVDCNFVLCFPEWSTAERATRVDATLAESGRSMLEAFRIWTRPKQALSWIKEIHGEEHLTRAREAGRGVLVLAPHLGAWELLNLYLATTGPGAVLYRAPSSLALESAIAQARAALGTAQIRADRNAPRKLIRRFNAGEWAGILPDQQPRVGEGVFAPFFGIDALTMTLAPRLAQRATTLFGWAERLPNSAGFRLHFAPAPAALADPDPVIAAGAMNAAIEALARQAPDQYAWTYKRFSLRPPGVPDRYTRDTRRRRRKTTE